VTEQEFAADIVAYLEEKGWEIYQEVDCGRVADIVGTKGNELCVVEVKKSFTAALVEQVWQWRGYADYLYVAIPEGKRYATGRNILNMFCREHGIGMLKRRINYAGKAVVEEKIKPNKIVVPLSRLRDALREEQKTFCKAGSAGGGHFTKFKGTCIAWAKFVKAHPGLPIRDVAIAVGHHYASENSACSNMLVMIERGVVEGIWVERNGSGNPSRLFPEEAKAAVR
jgi:hypothetical protein